MTGRNRTDGSGSESPTSGERSVRHSTGSEAIDRLEDATERAGAIRERIDREGEDVVERGAEAYRTAHSLLDHYQDTATGTGRSNFAAYVNLERQFAALVANLPEDLAEREAFEAARDAIDKRRLSEDDFERSRAALAPAERYVELLDERESAAAALHEARSGANRRLEALETEIGRLEDLQAMGSVDLDAPIERLREPIEAYDEAIRGSFESFLDTAPAREVFAVLDRGQWYPLVPFDRPPADLREYVQTTDAGESTIPELLEYAEYSRSKLSHHVDDADRLKRQVATQRTYLTRLDAAPLTIGWPPPDAATLRHRIREYRPLVARIADESVVAKLRAVEALTRDPAYERLRTAARAAVELREDERKRLRDGRVETDLAAAKEARSTLEAALERASDVLA